MNSAERVPSLELFRNMRSRIRTELLAGAVLLVATVITASHFDAMEAFATWSSKHEAWDIDEAAVGIMMTSLFMCVFSWRRWRELQSEMRTRSAVELRLRASEERLERVFASSPFPVMVTSFDGDTVLDCNEEFVRVTGHAKSEVLGQTTTALNLWVRPEFSDELRQTIRSSQRIRNEEVEFRTKSGIVHQALFSAELIPFNGHQAILAAVNDVSDRRVLEQRLEFQAFHDALTGLANRSLFRLRLEHALVRAARSGSRPTVLFLDLDDFKRVNDSLGHGVGDELLIAVSKRLLTCLRSEDTCARLGGDEFAILIEDAENADAGMQLAERLVPALCAPFELASTTAHIGVSVGVAIAEPDDTDEVMLRNADLAMYISKTDGKGCVTLYTPAMHEEVSERVRLEADLHMAIIRNEFIVHYQPIVSIETGAILSVEALVRWEHPTRGTLAPAVFIPIAESSGVVLELGRWVLHEACTAVRKIQLQFPRTPAISVAVNLSGRQIADKRCVQMVEEALRQSQLPATSLTLEITESVLVQNASEVIERLWALKKLGVRLAIDDFGTGYSSLSYLQRFPVDILKIDKSFTDRLGNGAEESPIACAVVALGNSVSLQTVAEGVETEEQWGRLRELGCERGQGFFFARPAEIDALAGLLAAEDVVTSLPILQITSLERDDELAVRA